MAYNESSGLIDQSGNVTFPYMQKAIRSSSNSLGVITTHLNINRKSRRKPYAFGGRIPNGLYGKNGNDESILFANNFGMTPTAISLPNVSGSTLDGCVKDWGQWRPPSGQEAALSPSGLDEPNRQSDFRGYSVNAGDHIKSYEILIDDKPTSYLQPARKGTTTVRLTFNPVDWSVRLTDFKYGSVNFSDMYLTLLIANYHPAYTLGSGAHVNAQWGVRMIVKQSAQKLGDVIGSSSAANKLEVTLNTSDATEALFAEFFNQSSPYGTSTNIFVAVGLASKYTPTSEMNAKAFGDGTMILAQGALPFTLVNFNMYNVRSYKVASICSDFMANATGQNYYFDAPCHLSTYQAGCNASYNSTTKEITVNLGGVYTAVVNYTNIPANCKNEGHIGFSFGVYIYGKASTTKWDQLGNDKWYFIATNKGMDQRGIKMQEGSLDTLVSDTDEVSSNDQQGLADLLYMKPLPTSGGIRISCPEAMNYTTLKVEVYCCIEGVPSTNGNDKFYPNVTVDTNHQGAIIETMIEAIFNR